MKRTFFLMVLALWAIGAWAQITAAEEHEVVAVYEKMGLPDGSLDEDGDEVTLTHGN